MIAIKPLQYLLPRYGQEVVRPTPFNAAILVLGQFGLSFYVIKDEAFEKFGE